MAGKKTAKKKIRKSVPHGRCYVQAGFGNTIISITDPTGEVIAWSSAGHLGFKGSRKGTPFAAQVVSRR
jgi:small subunit ribosomal protein S11